MCDGFVAVGEIARRYIKGFHIRERRNDFWVFRFAGLPDINRFYIYRKNFANTLV